MALSTFKWANEGQTWGDLVTVVPRGSDQLNLVLRGDDAAALPFSPLVLELQMLFFF